MRRGDPPTLEAALSDASEQVLLLLFASGGQDHVQPILHMLRDFKTLFEDPLGASIPGLRLDKYSIAFFYDADDEGAANKLASFKTHFSSDLGDLAALSIGGWSQANDIYGQWESNVND